MPDLPETLDALRGVALLNTDGPTGLRIVSARVPEGDLPRLRDAVDAARETGLTLRPGEWEDVLIVWSRPGRRPLPEALTAAPGAVATLRALLLELDR